MSIIKALDVVVNLAHNLKVVGSNPTPATKKLRLIKDLKKGFARFAGAFFLDSSMTQDFRSCSAKMPRTYSIRWPSHSIALTAMLLPSAL